MAYFAVNHLSFRYGKDPLIVEDFSAELDQGEVVALLGSSGSGKSTILRLMAGLELPESGSVVLDGKTLFERREGERRPRHNLAPQKRDIGLIFQDYALFPHLCVRKNVEFAVVGKKMSGAERRARATELLRTVRMEEHAHKYPHQLSGGQQQRVAIARALAAEPKVLLLDEPFSNLDAELRGAVRCDVRDIIKSAGVSAILVTHDEEDVCACADRSIAV